MLPPEFANFQVGLFFGAVLVCMLELQAYLSYKKSFVLGLIIPISFFLFCVYDFWSNSLKETLYIFFYETMNVVPLLIILTFEFIVFKIYGIIKRIKKNKRNW